MAGFTSLDELSATTLDPVKGISDKDDQKRIYDYLKEKGVTIPSSLFVHSDNIRVICERNKILIPPWFGIKYDIVPASLPAKKSPKSLPPAKISHLLVTYLTCKYVVIRTGRTSQLVPYFLSGNCSFNLECFDGSTRHSEKDLVLTPDTLKTGLVGYKCKYHVDDIPENKGVVFKTKPLYISDSVHGNGTYYQAGIKAPKLVHMAASAIAKPGTIAFRCDSISRAFYYARKLKKLSYSSFSPSNPVSMAIIRCGIVNILYMEYDGVAV